MTPKLVRHVAAVGISVACPDICLLVFLSSFQRQMIIMDSRAAFSSYLLLNSANQTVWGAIIISLYYYLFLFFLVEKFPIYHSSTTSFHLSSL